MDFKILTDITGVETIAAGSGIREVVRLRKLYGRGRWRKCKGFAKVRLGNGTIASVELHWYQAAKIGMKEFKIKRLL